MRQKCNPIKHDSLLFTSVDFCLNKVAPGVVIAIVYIYRNLIRFFGVVCGKINCQIMKKNDEYPSGLGEYIMVSDGHKWSLHFNADISFNLFVDLSVHISW